MTSHRLPRTLRQLAGLPDCPKPLASFTLVVIDAQVAYTQAGVLPLPYIAAASARIAELLAAARRRNVPIMHVAHGGAPTSAFLDAPGDTAESFEVA